MTEDKQPNEYQIMEVKDEDQILVEMSGSSFLQQYVYSFKQGTRDITSLSYVGIKEAIRKRGGVEIVGDPQVSEVNGKIRALVKVHDCIHNIDVLGVSEAESDKPFAYVLAVNKAERNAFAKLIPAKLFAELIAEKLGKKTVSKEVERSDNVPKDVTPISPSTSPADMEVPVCYQLRSWIQPEIMANLNVDEVGNVITLKPKVRLETAAFKEVCKIAEQFGGKWLKEEGYWSIPS
jgi:hypothetical protein